MIALVSSCDYFFSWSMILTQFRLTGKKLAEEWDSNEVGLVAAVDCTTGKGKMLCRQLHVQSFPTIMYGDPHRLKEYHGGRKYEELAEFAKQNLVPLCSPPHLDVCDEDTRKRLEEYLALPKEEIRAGLREAENAIRNAKEKYEEEMKALQQKYEEAARVRDETIASVRQNELGLLKAVENFRNKKPEDARKFMIKEEL